MATAQTWVPLEAENTAAVLRTLPGPLDDLAAGHLPAIVLRRAFPPDHCRGLVERFAQRGYLDPETVGKESQLSGGPYLDLGTSLGRVGANPEAFFAHAQRTHDLFSTLFDGFDDPVQTMYSALADLAPDKEVKTARETGDRLYGPAIFRMYHAAEGHKPHFDSVAKRSQPASDYAVARFQYQFAGVLCLQSGHQDQSDEPFIYPCRGTDPQMQEILQQDRFADYVAEHDLNPVQVSLEPGDLYFFCTENIHEVARMERQRRRIVLAFFFAMSADDPEIFVWS
ncbi:MAG: hypothetical protein GKR89_33910 [Candidatus Latescibacteria bacterium]|nr:hypothetical protein [Candidatus Latescibacterota bacterium]